MTSYSYSTRNGNKSAGVMNIEVDQFRAMNEIENHEIEAQPVWGYISASIFVLIYTSLVSLATFLFLMIS